MRQIAITLIVALTLATTACAPLEQTSRDAIATAKGFLDAEAKAHPECLTTPTGQACVLVNKGNAAKQLAITALRQYCTSPDFDSGNGPCVKPSGTAATIAASQLQAAINNLNQVIADIKALKG